MATRKGICPYCNIARFENRIFVVNPEAAICFCPNCMREVHPEDAIKAYDIYIKSLLDDADEALYVSCDPSLAYQYYADVIEVDGGITEAYLGRLLCMAYMSKVRSHYLKEARELLSDEVDEHFLKATELDKFIPFLKKINRVLDDYHFVLVRRLTYHKSYFHDEPCLVLFLERLRDIYLFKTDLLKYSMAIRRKYSDQNIEVLINLLEHSLDDLEKAKGKTYSITTGDKYHLANYKANGEAIIEKVEGKRTSFNTFKKGHLYTLDANVKGRKYINDTIFKNYTKIMKASKAAIFYYLFFYLLMAGAGVVAYFFHENNLIFLIALGAGGFFFLLGTVFLILRLSWKKIIKKRRLAIDQ